ncbi:MAG TPA: hypothetical protein VFL41_09895 [Gaiellaceae bacterium]|nr:hypothetical protein [Gaiellaceae bacterium]
MKTMAHAETSAAADEQPTGFVASWAGRLVASFTPLALAEWSSREGVVTGVVSTNATTLEGKVDYLMRRDQDSQMFAALAERVNRLETESPQRLDELRRQMEGHVARELMAALEAYRPLRVVGTILLAVGLGSVTTATLLA